VLVCLLWIVYTVDAHAVTLFHVKPFKTNLS
jgi:hypothetical protein